jgi:hypothetical protein
MKKTTLFVFAMLILNQLFAQKDPSQAVKDSYAKLTKAMIDADKATMLALTSPQLSYGHSGGKVENQQEFVNVIVSGQNDFSEIYVLEQTVQLAGKNAIVRNRQIVNLLNNGVATKVDFYVMSVFEKKGKNWVMLARQGYRLPQ